MRVNRLSTVLAVAVAGVLVVAVSTAAGARSKSHTRQSSILITTRSIHGLGQVLVNSRGRTLYMFVPDKRKKVTCVGGCAKIWPPIKLTTGAKVVASGGVQKALLGSDADPAGGRVVTYHGWPLYLYVGDTKPGQAYGQALNLNGGLWYVLSPSGAVIKAKFHAGGGGSTTTTTTSGGGGGTNCTDADGDGDEDAGGPDDGDGCI
jgi:predicted lipoprotein with Yx(FWY)xxD motif